MKLIFEGVCTALITPFKKSEVDYDCLIKLILRQINLGVNAILLCGTTGECATLSDYEYEKIIDIATQTINGKIPVLAGCGGNNTLSVIKRAASCKSKGVSAGLFVTPYYNKTTNNGLIAHYFKIADNAELPMILYNVPQRTGIKIDIKTYRKLITHPMIYGIKECSNNLSFLNSILLETCAVYAGNDSDIYTVTKSGGKGVISVVANLIPDKIRYIYRDIKAGNEEVKKQIKRYETLCRLMFKKVNPIPIKYAMKAANLCSNSVRMPLIPIKYDRQIDRELLNLKDDIL